MTIRSIRQLKRHILNIAQWYGDASFGNVNRCICPLLCRQKQNEAREQRDKLQMELDPGNPNWEFLKMIR